MRAFSQFPVKKKGRIVGSITEKRINQLIIEFGRDRTKKLKVDNVMEKPFPTIPQNTRLPVIIHLLQNNQAVIVVGKKW